jgi:GH15 family glucan-1,4-alpha-glucosidase
MEDGFVRRYDTSTCGDGLLGSEGVFLACSFWLADNFCLTDRWVEARRLVERLSQSETTSGFWPRSTKSVWDVSL